MNVKPLELVILAIFVATTCAAGPVQSDSIKVVELTYPPGSSAISISRWAIEAWAEKKEGLPTSFTACTSVFVKAFVAGWSYIIDLFRLEDEDKAEDESGDGNEDEEMPAAEGTVWKLRVDEAKIPEAEVVAVDLAAPYIRMARKWAEMRNITNVQFYHANAEEMSWLESETFDFINYAYVLHEMPADNAIRVVDEMYRLLKAGGTMNGFEVPFVDNLAARETYVLFNTWGHSWQEQGALGPEPYMEEYEFGVQLTNALATAGFNKVEFIDYSYFEGIFLATK